MERRVKASPPRGLAKVTGDVAPTGTLCGKTGEEVRNNGAMMIRLSVADRTHEGQRQI